MINHHVVRRTVLVASQIGITVLFIFLWQYGANHHVINTFFFSKPSAIWSYLKLWSSSNQPRSISTGTTLWQDLWSTVFVFGFGYLIGTALGIISGIFIGTVRIVREITEPFIVFCNAVPRLILLPVLVVIFGFGYLPQVILVILVIYFIVTITIAEAIQETPRNLLENAKILGANKINLVREIYFPSLIIWILSTSRLMVGLSLQAAVAAEFIGAEKGLGFRITDGQSRFRADEMFAAFVVVLVLALLVDMVLTVVEKRATRWMPPQS